MQGACLIVDDNATLRDASKVLIAKYGNIDAYTASSGQDAIDMCDCMEFDFVLMDISMPQMDGIEAAKLIKKAHPSTLIAGWTCEPEFIPKLDKEIFALVIHKLLQKSELKKLVQDLQEIASAAK